MWKEHHPIVYILGWFSFHLIKCPLFHQGWFLDWNLVFLMLIVYQGIFLTTFCYWIDNLAALLPIVFHDVNWPREFSLLNRRWRHVTFNSNPLHTHMCDNAENTAYFQYHGHVIHETWQKWKTHTFEFGESSAIQHIHSQD